MSRLVAAVGTQSEAAQTAQEFMLDGGSAVGAVLSGYFVDAGLRAGVLLGSLVLFVAGTGHGVRVFDGRLRQPGLGAKRPRGFEALSAVPGAAYVAVPQSISVAAVAHAYERSSSFADVVRQGVRRARLLEAEARANVLEAVQMQGARALSSQAVLRPLLRATGVSEGGLLTAADLAAVHEFDWVACPFPEAEGWHVAPWALDSAGSVGTNTAHGEVLMAVDSRGVFCGACYQCATDGVEIGELGLVAPKSAIPVMRGVPRTAPGSPIAAPGRMAVQIENATALAIAADISTNVMSETLINAPTLAIQRNAHSRQVTITRQ